MTHEEYERERARSAARLAAAMSAAQAEYDVWDRTPKAAMIPRNQRKPGDSVKQLRERARRAGSMLR